MFPQNKKINFFFISFCFIVAAFLLHVSGCFQNRKTPNVILITVDSLRPDHLSCYGYEKKTSPNIDKIAQEGVLFKQAVSVAPWTYPAMFTLFTSAYPHVHGMTAFQGALRDIPLLPQVLRSRKYYTAAVCSHYVLSNIKKLTRAFDEFISIEAKHENSWVVRNAKVVTDKAVSWLNNNYKKRFFLWIHYMDTHGPYNPPSPYDTMWNEPTANNGFDGLSVSQSRWLGVGGVPKFVTETLNLKDMSRQEYISRYDGAITFLDSQIGVLSAELKSRGLQKDTLVIITADHGESLGEHNYFGHEFLLYDTMLKVPLIMKYPDVLPSSKVIVEQAGIIDIMPTVFDIMHLKNSLSIDGRSLLSTVVGKSKHRNRHAYSHYHNYNKQMFAVRTEGWKLIFTENEKRYELYNLEEDPRELKNVFSENQQKAKLLKVELEHFIKRVHRSTPGAAKPSLDKEAMEKLKSLGYVQ